MLGWDGVILAVQSKLKSAISYADVRIIGGIQEYLQGAVGQVVNERDFLILLGHPDGNSQSNEPRISFFQRKRYDIMIAIIVKTDPTAKGRMFGVGKRSLFDVQNDIFRILEHDNLGGLTDNRAGTNFEVGWEQLPIDSKAFTVYSTIYSATKTEQNV